MSGPSDRSRQHINLGLDVDGTITVAPVFFALLARAVRDAGGQVHVITSRSDSIESRVACKAELSCLGIEHDKLHMLPDAEQAGRRCPHQELDWYQKYLWQKVQYCLDNGIDVFFDDEQKVVALFGRFAPGIRVFRPVGKQAP